jgi:hypothetical protein
MLTLFVPKEPYWPILPPPYSVQATWLTTDSCHHELPGSRRGKPKLGNASFEFRYGVAIYETNRQGKKCHCMKEYGFIDKAAFC